MLWVAGFDIIYSCQDAEVDVRSGLHSVPSRLGIAAAVVPGIQFAGEGSVSIVSLLVVALIFGLVNALIKPILAVLTCPFYILTLGLFTFVINALMLMLTSWLAGPRFEVAGFWPALLFWDITDLP